MPGTIFHDDATSERAFRDFLCKAKDVPDFLPPWWTDARTEAAVAYGLRTDHNFSLHYASEKADIQEDWKDDRMPMKVRMLGEKVYGNAPGVPPGGGASMLELMMSQEAGTGPGIVSNLDLGPSTVRRSPWDREWVREEDGSFGLDVCLFVATEKEGG
ncbi:Ankyrin repeat and MYND domain-containing protein 2 [Saxophila tyrrhenica]|uniref:Ankyrin repeat and MYND domain-containing protein 2 n=1 Tax=Saxophila tyrrhenica TaxID=1690608 RepID=A0AAV9PLV4_9PEZI|nr:Ankyrin repeat and MYND domain-containing protein 2 [Saxophila tyrrhenica]